MNGLIEIIVPGIIANRQLLKKFAVLLSLIKKD